MPQPFFPFDGFDEIRFQFGRDIGEPTKCPTKLQLWERVQNLVRGIWTPKILDFDCSFVSPLMDFMVEIHAHQALDAVSTLKIHRLSQTPGFSFGFPLEPQNSGPNSPPPGRRPPPAPPTSEVLTGSVELSLAGATAQQVAAALQQALAELLQADAGLMDGRVGCEGPQEKPDLK